MGAQDHLKARANSFWSFHDRWKLLSVVVTWVDGLLASKFPRAYPRFCLASDVPHVQGSSLQINESITCQRQMSLNHCGVTGQVK
jgi:hypothetical protein